MLSQRLCNEWPSGFSPEVLLKPMFFWGLYQNALHFTSTPRKPTKHNKAPFFFNLSHFFFFFPFRAIVLRLTFPTKDLLRDWGCRLLQGPRWDSLCTLCKRRLGASWRCTVNVSVSVEGWLPPSSPATSLLASLSQFRYFFQKCLTCETFCFSLRRVLDFKMFHVSGCFLPYGYCLKCQQEK